MRHSTLCCHILHNVGDRVGLALNCCGAPRHSSCACRINCVCVVNVIVPSAVLVKAFRSLAACKLGNNAAYHFKVGKLLGTYIVIGMGHLGKPVKQAFAGILFNRFKGFHKPFQEECAEIRECIYLVAVAHIIECKLKAVLNIAVFVALYQGTEGF